jgi:thiol:disulfide interchange protein DsbD
MILTRVGLISAFVGAALSYGPQDVQQRPEPVKWGIAAVHGSRAAVGRTFEVKVTATIDAGWHLYAPTQPAGGPMAMTVTVPTGQPFSLGGKVIEPPPTRRVDRTSLRLGETFTFDSRVDFTVPIRVDVGGKTGRQVLRVQVEFQACSATKCLRPTTTELHLAVMINN